MPTPGRLVTHRAGGPTHLVAMLGTADLWLRPPRLEAGSETARRGKLVAKRFYLFVLVLALLVAACGGSDDESAPATTDAAEGGITTEAPAESESADPGSDSADSEDDTPTTTTVAVQSLGDGDEDTTFFGNQPGTGTVEIGDIKYEFDLNLLCLSMFGAMGVAGVAADGSDIQVDADFPPPGWEDSADDWEPPAVNVDDDGHDVSWEAGASIAEFYEGDGVGEITSFSADGRVAVGEANFVDTYSGFDNPTVEKGRFEFVCPEG